MTESQAALESELSDAKNVRSAAIRAMRKIYHGHEPCAERAKNPAYDAAHTAAEKATADCNVIIDQINRGVEAER
jgi:hypothetical protein